MNTVAALQMTSSADVAENLATAQRLLEQAAGRGAALAALPENFAFMGLKETDKRAVSESDGAGPIQDFLADTAQRLKMWIVGGTLPIKAASSSPLPPGEGPGVREKAAAACLIFDANGQRRARYDKIHLFDVNVPGATEEHRESSSMFPGREPVVIDTPVGKLGLAVCYDLRFPELFRRLSAAGAQWFCLPSAFTWRTGRAHWETLLKARAIENLSFMVAPAQTGSHANGRETYGDTMIVDYWGRILSRLPRGPGVIIASLDRTRQAEIRQSFPALEHRIFIPT